MSQIDYAITAVFPVEKSETILFATVHQVVYGSFNGIPAGVFLTEASEDWARQEIAEAISDGKVFWTAAGKLSAPKFGAEVVAYSEDADGVPFIRTKGNGSLYDNLEELSSSN